MSIKQLGWGESVPGSEKRFLRLKEKGDKVQFRILQDPFYTGKHFMEKEKGWDISECSRITDNQECQNCNEYFRLMGKVKKLKSTNPAFTNDSPEIKELRDQARKFNVAIEFYFPIIDRADGKFKILQTTQGVRNKFNAQYDAGNDPMDTEWVLMNTGSASPAERYMLSPVDSKKVTKYSVEEEEEIKKGEKFDVSSMFKDKDEEPKKQEDQADDVNPSDIPF